MAQCPIKYKFEFQVVGDICIAFIRTQELDVGTVCVDTFYFLVAIMEIK
jgi:hypothetical protein